jgi:glucose-6-phosphate isomerase
MLAALVRRMDLAAGSLTDGTMSHRRLSDLRGCFADEQAFERRLAAGNDLVYTVSSAGPESGLGDLAFGLGTVLPGRVGDEYFLTKGHDHQWREAAEVYVGLAGRGGLVLEDKTGARRFVPMTAGDIVYVPGSTAHRTVNTGDEPLSYLGIYPADAGHDYANIAADNFGLVVVAGATGPEAAERTAYLRRLTDPA